MFNDGQRNGGNRKEEDKGEGIKERNLKGTGQEEERVTETRNRQDHHPRETTLIPATMGPITDKVEAVDKAHRGDQSERHRSIPKWQ